MCQFARIITLGLFCLGMAFVPADSGEKDKKEPAKTKGPETTDVTAQVRAMNSKEFQAPPTQFRTGHATPRKLDAKVITQTETGFSIELPSKAPVPTPTVYKGKLYVSGGFHSKEYYCFDAITGKVVWGVDLDDDGPTSAVVEDDIVVFNTESCTIFALDAQTGKQLWSYFLGDPLTSTPTIAKGKVFTSYPAMGGGGVAAPPQNKGPDAKPQAAAKRPNASHVLACIELKTGKILWQRWIDSDVMSAPVAVDGEVYATSFGGTVYKFKQDDGTIISAQASRATSAPVVVGNNIFLTTRADKGKDGKVSEKILGSDKDRLEAKPLFESEAKEAKYLDARIQDKSEFKNKGAQLDAGNGFGGGAPAQANPEAAKKNVGQANVSTMQAFQGSRILNYGYGNFNCMGNEVVCTDPKTGKLQWAVKVQGDLEKTGGFLASAPAAAGGKIFISTVQGEVLQMDPKDGKVIAKYKIGSPARFQPAIQGGRIYVGTENGRVVCIDTGNPQFTGWTTWGANSAHTNVVEKQR
jgi:Ca-activated chloride channel homolog